MAEQRKIAPTAVRRSKNRAALGFVPKKETCHPMKALSTTKSLSAVPIYLKALSTTKSLSVVPIYLKALSTTKSLSAVPIYLKRNTR
jgi:hypothetical protein